MSTTIKVDVHKGKLISFDLDIQGLESAVIHGKFRIIIDEIEYGFPTTIKDHQVEVYLPCLHDVMHEIKTYGGYIQAKLEIFADHHYFVPWEGKLKIIEPATIKAKIKASKPKVKTINTESKDKDVKEEAEIIVDEPEEEVTLPDPTKKEKETVSEQTVISESTKSEYLDMLKSIDEEGIRSYMRRAGTKSKHIQDIILEQADGICKNSDDKFELLKSVVKVMKQVKNGGQK